MWWVREREGGVESDSLRRGLDMDIRDAGLDGS